MPSARFSVNSASSRKEVNAPNWREAIKAAVRDPVLLCRHLELPESYHGGAIRASKSFPVFAPLEFLARMRKGDPTDPLLRQVLPLAAEDESGPKFTADPVEDQRFQIAPGLLQKYEGRALLITGGACAIHCRYCFRRHFPYAETPPARELWKAAADRLAQDDSIDEIILSGGDPLTQVDTALAELAQMLAAVPHLRRLRVHTRLPIVIPQRVTSELLAWLTGTRLAPLIVVHVNHPAEVDEATAAALGRLIDTGVPVLNQTVLLRGVNDDAEVLTELSRRLVNLRVLPYYLHQLDRVAGAAHFETPVEHGRRLIAELQRCLPGYAVPRYVQEVPGAAGKSPLL